GGGGGGGGPGAGTGGWAGGCGAGEGRPAEGETGPGGAGRDGYGPVTGAGHGRRASRFRGLHPWLRPARACAPPGSPGARRPARGGAGPARAQTPAEVLRYQRAGFLTVAQARRPRPDPLAGHNAAAFRPVATAQELTGLAPAPAVPLARIRGEAGH